MDQQAHRDALKYINTKQVSTHKLRKCIIEIELERQKEYEDYKEDYTELIS